MFLQSMFILKIVILYMLFFFMGMDFIKNLPMVLPILLSVAFFTVLESKVLASMQRSSGPNNVGIYGLLQAIADALKLLSKETLMPSSSNVFLFMLSPMFTFMMSMLCWSLMPFDFNIVMSDLNLGLLFLFAFSSLGVYGMMMSGWSSNSKYAFLGSLSSSAQFISYEISMGLLLMPMMLFTQTINMSEIVLAQTDVFFIFPFFPFFILFLMTGLAETNSVPFDLPEAESELVSGYNVEYSSMGFTFFFLAEYSNIMLMSSIIVILFLGGWLPMLNIFLFKEMYTSFWFSLKLLFIMFFFVWVSATLPSYRYDQLMMLGWKVMLPLSLGFCFLSMFFFFLFI